MASIDASMATAAEIYRDDLIETRCTLTAGIGIFAKKHISIGTRLICERPLFLFGHDQDAIELLDIVADLPDPDAFWNLAATSNEHIPGSHEIIVTALNKLRDRSDGEDFEDVHDRFVKIWEIYKTNTFNVPTNQHGMFAKTSRINHSCSPNVFHGYSTALGCITIQATRHICPGEEIVTSYIELCQSTADRCRLLRSSWGFSCVCKRCIHATAERNDRRNRIGTRLAKLRRDKAEIKKFAAHGRNELESELQYCLDTIADMELEGLCESDTAGEVYVFAAQSCRGLLSLGHTHDTQLADQGRESAGRACEISRICLGDDNLEHKDNLDLKTSITA